MTCEWCETGEVIEQKASVYWELPDGSRAIEITNVPTLICMGCTMEYQAEKVVKEIENHLYLIDFRILPARLSYSQLFEQPKILKKNYFDFSS